MSNSTGPAQLRLPPARSGWWHNTKIVLGVLMFGGFLVAMCIHTAPDLLADWRVRAAARPVPDGRVVKGSCSTNLVFNICDATLTVPTPSGVVSRSVNYVFTDVHFGGYSVRVMADPARPDLPTTDMALDRLWNRTITLVAAFVLLLAFTVLPPVAMLRRSRRTA